jgi:hypothetical protein
MLAMNLFKLFSIVFILHVSIGLSVLLAQQTLISDNLVKCSVLPDDMGEVEPTGADSQIFQQLLFLAEQENYPTKQPSREFLKKIEGYVPKIQSPAFRGRIVMVLINDYIGLNDILEVERLVDKELKQPDIDKASLLRLTNAFVGCRHNIPKCKNLLEEVLKRSDLSRKQRFYFQGRYALLCDSQEKIKVLSEIEKEFPEETTCFAVLLEQAAHTSKNPEEAFMLMSKISDVDSRFLKTHELFEITFFMLRK